MTGTMNGTTAPSMELDFATAWEAISDEIPEAEALICGSTRRSWREYEDRAARVARILASAGLEQAANAGLALFNGTEYSEVQFACFKQRVTPFNVNFRYTARELHSLLEGADAQALFFDATLAPLVDEIRDSLPKLRLLVQVGGEAAPDGVLLYEEAIAASEPAPRIDRSPDDLWMLFTGGTTGHPKGVMWPHGNLIQTMKATYAGLKQEVPRTIPELLDSVRRIAETGRVTRQLAAAPLMHGTSGIAALTTHMTGGVVITLPERSFSADALFRCVEENRATHLTIVGDAFSRPMVAALEAAQDRGEPYDLSSIFLILSSGVMWSAPIKQALLSFNPRMRLLDSLGSSEGVGFAAKLESDPKKATTASFRLGEFTKVINDEGKEVVPGSGERGRLALGGPLPIGYYKDPEKSEETWPTIDGRRYSIPGDYATVEADGTITLLGRGSACINSGGEKIYPEEVEEALKLHPAVADCNVVGVPDERWGQAITAVVQLKDPSVDDEALIGSVKENLAAYKAPKHIVRVEELARHANGKSNYRWASETARKALGL
ncbi:MAG TPA: acyl-CoA synthetase [Deltaproteobacteria bacterium]|nr:acyl-CoA synthetase [Deltaproteobacteria bacterium]